MPSNGENEAGRTNIWCDIDLYNQTPIDTMSYTQDKTHSSALLGAILSGEKAQQQSAAKSSDSASIFSTSSFGSTKALLKKLKGNKSSKASKASSPSEAEVFRIAQRNQVRMPL
ncbi:hypothetical protein F4677DRAFT_328421 [Hypoxylon crocopeplum]|nr:hypothetical protein F4677DRAFT_328421 [Hypoxylon crocopeplum]